MYKKRILSMLMKFFNDDSPISRDRLLHAQYTEEEIDIALQQGYIFHEGNNYIGGSPLYIVTDKGKKLRNE